MDTPYRRWLTRLRFDHPAQQVVLQDYIHSVHDAEERIARLMKQIEDLVPTWSMAPVVEAFQAMRGVAFVVAVTVVAEVGDFTRFDNPRQVMAYLGLTPSEHSSGTAIRRGDITKAGNALARRVLIEGAWTYRMQARVSRKLHDDRPPHVSPSSRADEVRARAWRPTMAKKSRETYRGARLSALPGGGAFGFKSANLTVLFATGVGSRAAASRASAVRNACNRGA